MSITLVSIRCICIFVQAQVTAYFKGESGEYEMIFASTKEDLCTYLNGENIGSKFFRVVQKEFAIHGNMDHPCPYAVS